MNRSLFITIHLYLSSFFAAAVLLVAISGGLYLLGYKGSVEKTPVATLLTDQYSLPSGASKSDLTALLEAAGVEGFAFDYVRQSGNRAMTRPTSRTHFIVEAGNGEITVTRAEPDLQGKMIELHKGHGPTVFKTFQKVFAVGMVFIILSGLWLGLSSDRLRRNTGISAGVGFLVFIALVLA